MRKLIQKIIVILFFTLMLGVSFISASGKIEVKIGGDVDLKGESTLTGATYQWVTKKGTVVLNKQIDQNYKYKFLNQGEYTVNLTASTGSKSESTTVNVLVGERYRSKISQTVSAGTQSLYMILETLPQLSADKQVVISGDSGKVHFLMEQSVGEILEYRIDKNVYKDSDGNGVANDDIDNSNDNSYLTGTAWSTDYKKGETSKITAQITLVDKKGKKVSDKVDIVFESQTKTGDPTAVLDISPAPSAKDGLVHLYKATHKVAFYSRRSTGDITEYRIDKNVFVDSDGDGDPKNDIDNLKDISFKTGDVWITSYAKTDNQITAQLIIVGKEGKGSRVQKGIVFGAKPTPPSPSLSSVKDGINLTADKSLVYKGDPITFTVTGLTLGMSEYTFDWDLDADGKIDKEVTGVNTIKHSFSKAGVVKVKVSITDKKKNKLDKTLEVTVKETELTKADFTYAIDGNKVTFTNTATAAHSLSDKTLTYVWSFGDTDSENYKKQENQKGVKSPVYTYTKLGKHVVALTIVDADKVTDTKTQTIEITKGAVQSNAKKSSGGSILMKILKIFLSLIIIVIFLILLIVGGFLAFLKVQHPDLTFGELIDELKVKILTKIGAYDEHDAEKPPEVAEETPPPSEVEMGEVVGGDDDAGSDDLSNDEDEESDEPSKHDFVPAEEAPATENGPTPSWLEDKDVIEGEDVSSDDELVETDNDLSEEDELEDDDFVETDSDLSTEEGADESDDEISEDEDTDFENDEEGFDELDEDLEDDDFIETDSDLSTEEGAPDWLTDDGSDEDMAEEDVSDDDLVEDDEPVETDSDLSEDDEIADDTEEPDETIDDTEEDPNDEITPETENIEGSDNVGDGHVRPEKNVEEPLDVSADTPVSEEYIDVPLEESPVAEEPVVENVETQDPASEPVAPEATEQPTPQPENPKEESAQPDVPDWLKG